MNLTTWVLVIALLFALYGGISVYKGLASLRQQTFRAWNQVDVQLKKRHDLLPSLVEKVRDSGPGVLDEVSAARETAETAKSIGDKAAAEQQISSSIQGLLALAEKKPELRASPDMANLHEEIKS